MKSFPRQENAIAPGGFIMSSLDAGLSRCRQAVLRSSRRMRDSRGENTRLTPVRARKGCRIICAESGSETSRGCRMAPGPHRSDPVIFSCGCGTPRDGRFSAATTGCCRSGSPEARSVCSGTPCILGKTGRLFRSIWLARIVRGTPMQEFYCTKIHDFVKVSVGTLGSSGSGSSYLEGCLRAGDCGIKCGKSGRFLDPNECPLNLEVFLRELSGNIPR